MRQPAWVIAFHGCDRRIGETILQGKKEVRPSRNEYDWLGSGAYFWENSYRRALKWAKFMASGHAPKAKRIAAPFVIGAIIDPGECLDLCEDGCLAIVKRSHSQYAQWMTDLGFEMPKNEKAHSADEDLIKRHLDCSTINFLHEMRVFNEESPFDTVRCPFMEGGPLYQGAKIYSKTHVQWCVRDPRKSVLGYFRPRLPI